MQSAGPPFATIASPNPYVSRKRQCGDPCRPRSEALRPQSGRSIVPASARKAAREGFVASGTSRPRPKLGHKPRALFQSSSSAPLRHARADSPHPKSRSKHSAFAAAMSSLPRRQFHIRTRPLPVLSCRPPTPLPAPAAVTALAGALRIPLSSSPPVRLLPRLAHTSPRASHSSSRGTLQLHILVHHYPALF